jgi:hypothetical protein
MHNKNHYNSDMKACPAWYADTTKKKTKRNEPDKQVLDELLTASQNFDIHGVESALKELESYEYKKETDNMLIEYLTENAMSLGFREITATLRLIHEVETQNYFQDQY